MTCYKKRLDSSYQENEKLNNNVDALKLEVDEKYQELSLLRQKYSRTNQPRSGGKFASSGLENETTGGIRAGDRFICIKNVDMGCYIAFTKGNEYLSEADGCVTNSTGNKNHLIGRNFAKLHFKLLKP